MQTKKLAVKKACDLFLGQNVDGYAVFDGERRMSPIYKTKAEAKKAMMAKAWGETSGI